MKRIWPAFIVLGAVPLVIRHGDARTSAATALCLLLAAVGLNLAAGYAGQPSLGQGAFMGVGAYAFALLRTRADWDPVIAAVAAIVIAGAGGWVIARGVARLRPAFVALTTWLITWTFAVALAAFPSVSGGSGGIVLGATRLRLRAIGASTTLGPPALYEISLVACAIGFAIASSFVRRWGPALGALRNDPHAAASEGIDVSALRRHAIVMSAVYSGAAGALLVMVSGVADPTRYGPLLSVKLFIVVVLGGAATLLGPAAGLISLLAVSQFTRLIASAAGSDAGRLEPLVAGAALVIVLVIAGRGIVPEIAARVRKRVARESTVARPGSYVGASIATRDITVDYDGVRALDRVTLVVGAGTIHAIVGPNGSGKTTLLRAMSGVVVPSDGAVMLDDIALGAGSRVAMGIARTFQRTVVVPDAIARDHVLAGMESRRDASLVRALARAPSSRRDERIAMAEAEASLGVLGLGEHAADIADHMST